MYSKLKQAMVDAGFPVSEGEQITAADTAVMRDFFYVTGTKEEDYVPLFHREGDQTDPVVNPPEAPLVPEAPVVPDAPQADAVVDTPQATEQVPEQTTDQVTEQVTETSSAADTPAADTPAADTPATE